MNKKEPFYQNVIQCKKFSPKKNEIQPDIIISYLDITEAVYSSLISLKNIISNKENLEAEIDQRIITFIQKVTSI